MLSILCVRLTIKVKVGIPESFKVGWYPPKKTGSSHLKSLALLHLAELFTNKLKTKFNSFFNRMVLNTKRIILLTKFPRKN